jgi:hypothetical protein
MPPKSELHVIPSSDLQGFASALFQALGVAGVLEPEPFVAVTERVRVFPTSADTGT